MFALRLGGLRFLDLPGLSGAYEHCGRASIGWGRILDNHGASRNGEGNG